MLDTVSNLRHRDYRHWRGRSASPQSRKRPASVYDKSWCPCTYKCHYVCTVPSNNESALALLLRVSTARHVSATRARGKGKRNPSVACCRTFCSLPFCCRKIGCARYQLLKLGECTARRTKSPCQLPNPTTVMLFNRRATEKKRLGDPWSMLQDLSRSERPALVK